MQSEKVNLYPVECHAELFWYADIKPPSMHTTFVCMEGVFSKVMTTQNRNYSTLYSKIHPSVVFIIFVERSFCQDGSGEK